MTPYTFYTLLRAITSFVFKIASYTLIFLLALSLKNWQLAAMFLFLIVGITLEADCAKNDVESWSNDNAYKPKLKKAATIIFYINISFLTSCLFFRS